MAEFIQNFHLLRPLWLWALIPIIILLVLIYRHRQSGQVWRNVCDEELLPYILTTESHQVSRWPFLLLIFGAFLLMVALLGPVWQKAPQPAFRTESALIVVLDLSLSMMAEDIKPSRLQRAKLKVLDVLRRRVEGQTALIVFSLESFTVSPLTQDSNTIELMIPALNADIMPSQGSQLHLAIEMAQALFLQSGVTNGHVLAVTDSGTDAAIEQSINELTAKGHTLSILGVGTAEGAPIRSQGGGFVKDRIGSIVIPKLDARELRSLARLGGGRYHTLSSTDDDINYLLKLIERQQKAKQKDKKMPFETDVWIEQGPWLILLLLPIAAIYFRRGWLMVVFLGCMPIPQSAYAFDWQYLWSTPDQVGQKYYDEGDHKLAAKHFQRPDWNAASSYNAGDYEESVKQWEGMSNTESSYNKGNALVKSGKLEEALQAYNEAIKLDKNNQDAVYNRDLVKKYLQDQQSDPNNKDKQDQDQQSQDGEQESKQQNKSNQQSGGEQQDEQGSSENAASQQQDSESKDADSEKKEDNANDNVDKDTDNNDGKNELAKQKSEQESKQEKVEQKATNESGEKNNGDMTPEQLLEKNKKEERRMAVEQWIRRVPDDPGGLLRRKFRYQAQVRGGKVKGTNPW